MPKIHRKTSPTQSRPAPSGLVLPGFFERHGGLVVGILSLGILALRAIVERKHLIGVMRAIGYHKRNVLFGLLLEAGLTATLGIAVGCAAGLAMGYIFYTLFFQEAVFGVLWHSLWNAFVLVYVAVLLVTIGPAWRASRLPPAEAVRWIE